jgi:hypothetical protein
MSEIVKLPFARTAEGRMVSVEAVERAGDCSLARETALHLFAKQVICDQLFVALPDPVGTMTKATAEQRLGDVVPDVLAEFDSGNSVAIEIWVAHQVPDSKVRTYNRLRQAALEIDLRPYRLTDNTEADWEHAVLHEAERVWLSPPEHIRRARDLERARWLQEQRGRMEVSIRQTEAFERQRATVEKALAKLNAEKAAHEQIEQTAAELHFARQREREHQAAAEYEKARLKLAEERAKEAEFRRAMIARLRRQKHGPDLQTLVRAHGSWDRITAEAWQAYDQELAEWRERVALGAFHEERYRSRSWLLPDEEIAHAA